MTQITKQPLQFTTRSAGIQGWFVGALFCLNLVVLPQAAFSDDRDTTRELSKLGALAVDEGFKSLLIKEPELCEGGTYSDSRNKHWLAVAVGCASLHPETGAEISLSDARKVARAKSNRELAMLVHGFRMSAEDKSVTQSTSRSGHSEILEVFRSFTRQEVDATLTRAEIVGTWTFNEGQTVAVMVAIGDPKHPMLAGRAAAQPLAKRRNEKWEKGWRDIFATRRAILDGGASVIRQNGKVVILAVGKAKLRGDEIADRNKELVAVTNAGREALQFVKGLNITSQTTATQEFRRFTADEVTTASDIQETFNSDMAERLLKSFRQARKVGSWESDDGQFFYCAVALNLADVDLK